MGNIRKKTRREDVRNVLQTLIQICSEAMDKCLKIVQSGDNLSPEESKLFQQCGDMVLQIKKLSLEERKTRAAEKALSLGGADNLPQLPAATAEMVKLLAEAKKLNGKAT